MTSTPSQTIGPFFGFALPFGDDATCSPDGVRIEGQVLDGAGDPVPDALLELSAPEQFGRCNTDSEGAFHFLVREPEDGFATLVLFARGLLRPLHTRVYFPGRDDAIPASVEPERRSTLVAHRDHGGLRFDVRLQGAGETVFFSLE